MTVSARAHARAVEQRQWQRQQRSSRTSTPATATKRRQTAHHHGQPSIPSGDCSPHHPCPGDPCSIGLSSPKTKPKQRPMLETPTHAPLTGTCSPRTPCPGAPPPAPRASLPPHHPESQTRAAPPRSCGMEGGEARCSQQVCPRRQEWCLWLAYNHSKRGPPCGDSGQRCPPTVPRPRCAPSAPCVQHGHQAAVALLVRHHVGQGAGDCKIHVHQQDGLCRAAGRGVQRHDWMQRGGRSNCRGRPNIT